MVCSVVELEEGKRKGVVEVLGEEKRKNLGAGGSGHMPRVAAT